MKKITVIIPVYNGETYLGRCIDSVLTQENFKPSNIEIIILNDGSTDGSLKIIKQYKRNFPECIRVIDQHNMGVAKTRNKGIQLAEATFITFLDQDDYLDADFIEHLYNEAEKGKYDVVSGGYKRPNSKGKIVRRVQPNGTEFGKYLIPPAWAKIHRTEFLQKNKIEFFDNSIGEDHVFTLKEITCTPNWKQIEYTGYNWYFNEASVSNASQKGLSNVAQRSLIVLLERLKDTGDRQNPLFVYYIIRTIVFYLLFSGRKASPKTFVSLYKELFVWLEVNFPNVYRNKYVPFSPKGELPIARLAIPIFIFLHRTHSVSLFAKVYCQDAKNG